MQICLFFNVWEDHDNCLEERQMDIKKIGYVSIAKLAAVLCLALFVGCSIPTMVPDMRCSHRILCSLMVRMAP